MANALSLTYLWSLLVCFFLFLLLDKKCTMMNFLLLLIFGFSEERNTANQLHIICIIYLVIASKYLVHEWRTPWLLLLSFHQKRGSLCFRQLSFNQRFVITFPLVLLSCNYFQSVSALWYYVMRKVVKLTEIKQKDLCKVAFMLYLIVRWRLVYRGNFGPKDSLNVV